MCRVLPQRSIRWDSAANFQSICSLHSGTYLLFFLQTLGPIWASPLRISFDSYPDVWHQRWASNPNTYWPCSLFLQHRKKHSRSVITAQVSCIPCCLPSHTTTSSISSAQCYWSKNHPSHRLPACYSYDLEQFILDLWTWTHLSNSYKQGC